MTDQYETYDYAWQQRGWTTQDPTLPSLPVLDLNGDPGLPDDVPKVLVVGSFADEFTGRGLEGVFQWRSTDILLYTTTDTEIMPSVQTLRFTDAQPLAVLIPATDSDTLTTINPDGFKYEFRLTVQGITRTGLSDLPTNPDPVDVWTLLNGS